MRAAGAAPETWRGKISDAMCKGDHKDNGGTLAKDHECSVKCAKNGSFVFVTEKDKKPVIYKIANQDMKEVTQHAGHPIDLTGDGIRDFQVFNPDGTTTRLDGRTGMVF